MTKYLAAGAMVLIVVLAYGQATRWDDAYRHEHNKESLITVEGIWAGRQQVPNAPGTTFDANAFTIKIGGATMQFYRRFDPVTDGPMIAVIESHYQSVVRVTYDPACGYATKFEYLSSTPIPIPPDPTPTPTPAPTPTPTPVPIVIKPPLKPCAVGQWCYWAWDSTQDKRVVALNNAVAYGCDPAGPWIQTGSYVYCVRAR